MYVKKTMQAFWRSICLKCSNIFIFELLVYDILLQCTPFAFSKCKETTVIGQFALFIFASIF